MGKYALYEFFSEFQMCDSACLMAAAHFNRSNCHTVPIILSSFDVRFKGLQSCQWLCSDTSPAINCESKADLLMLSLAVFLYYTRPNRH